MRLLNAQDLLDQPAGHLRHLADLKPRKLLITNRSPERAQALAAEFSVGGMTAMPTMSIYSASKFALEGASESLWYEMRPFGVRVSLVRPGFINSDGFRKVRFIMR